MGAGNEAVTVSKRTSRARIQASEKSVIMLLILLNSLVPRPRLAFRRLQFFLSRFSILIVTESWMGPRNEATSECLWTMGCTAILSTEC